MTTKKTGVFRRLREREFSRWWKDNGCDEFWAWQRPIQKAYEKKKRQAMKILMEPTECARQALEELGIVTDILVSTANQSAQSMSELAEVLAKVDEQYAEAAYQAGEAADEGGFYVHDYVHVLPEYPRDKRE